MDTTQVAGSMLGDVSLWRSFAMLALVLVLIVAAIWFLRRIQRGRPASALDLEIIGRVGLAPKQFLSVVRVGKEHWVLGVTPDSIRFIGEYQGDLPAAGGRSVKAAAGFAGLFETSVKRLSRAVARRRETAIEAG